MRTWGKDASGKWVEISTAANGDNTAVWLTTLCQCLLLVLGEAPFNANCGIPAQRSVTQQLPPDFYVAQTQNQFAPYFASLIIAKITGKTPAYRINVLTKTGVQGTVNLQVPF